MTSRLVSLALRMWPRTGQVATPQQSWATADLWRRVISASNSDDEDDIESVAEALDRLAAETEEDPEATARRSPPSASEEAVWARRDSVRDHYRSLVASGPAARTSPFDNGVANSLSRDADPIARRDALHRERSMREREAQQLHRPNLNIPINGGEEYVTLAQ
uniref:Uncharacterized protein n=1 Tax=Odontella aurita TaxID=265563 RepID=A0A7S4JQQ6_9STRA|mmetsp:Transcript_51993/g.156027  ORF Transcript_51993/g.156027 Transcript_51993/m.156027 type:complete len:163 (+) Transcript_51993:144-632(+)|eukprot:CAMPEP_0113563782 /NCGR_PEP_ID=MMETSP0015_2-20120614/21255_1 /TAXON_ID=2838 /ORGANISM="Odontella" /LENGTH=162 /DNA_ID=CAMNT_0000465791 /DNA_START=71 /DNA_END=559 /DNA_ORIENTATION=+ /assembly_acc=CAM_ASM_000160